MIIVARIAHAAPDMCNATNAAHGLMLIIWIYSPEMLFFVARDVPRDRDSPLATIAEYGRKNPPWRNARTEYIAPIA